MFLLCLEIKYSCIATSNKLRKYVDLYIQCIYITIYIHSIVRKQQSYMRKQATSSKPYIIIAIETFLFCILSLKMKFFICFFVLAIIIDGAFTTCVPPAVVGFEPYFPEKESYNDQEIVIIGDPVLYKIKCDMDRWERLDL